MEHHIKKIFIPVACLLILVFGLNAYAGNLYGKASIGTSTLLNGNLSIKPAGELYIRQNRLDITGNYSGKSGSKIYLSANADKNGFVNISGTVTGETEIIPDIFAAWNGSRIDFVKASQTGSVTSAFQMTDNVAQLKYEKQNDYLLWYIEKTKIDLCLPLIVQLGNHTLLANNNSATNGGYKFASYAWYKNGQLLQEDAHADNGGSYYTGGADLDEDAEYAVTATDSEGKHYFSCPYRFAPMALPINVTVYPNPLPRNAKAYIQAETQDLSLLQDARVDIYDMLGQYVGKANINGQTLTSVNFPSKTGIYILKFRAKDYVRNIKITVE
ncbi:MAG: T9SS type A sorting domain-containing protein [Prevotellaceae bacterium]|jgi:hypothetical protein|nr:T9SS type A sorting domain-containing protein [Prevotellaceae bacterium]